MASAALLFLPFLGACVQASPRTSTQVSRCIYSENHGPDLPSIGPCGPSLIQSGSSSLCVCTGVCTDVCMGVSVLAHESESGTLPGLRGGLGSEVTRGAITGSVKVPSQRDEGHMT